MKYLIDSRSTISIITLDTLLGQKLGEPRFTEHRETIATAAESVTLNVVDHLTIHNFQIFVHANGYKMKDQLRNILNEEDTNVLSAAEDMPFESGKLRSITCAISRERYKHDFQYFNVRRPQYF